MDIKDRIDKLTEQEAKGALEWMIMMCAYDLPCKSCDVWMRCSNQKINCTGDINCMNKLLDESLKEAQK